MNATSNTFQIVSSLPQQLRAMAVGQTWALPIRGASYSNYMVARNRLHNRQEGRWTQEWAADRRTLLVTRIA